MILKCDGCKGNKDGKQGANFQDAQYGVNMRVMVECAAPNTWRCTVCDKETVKGAPKKEGKK